MFLENAVRHGIFVAVGKSQRNEKNGILSQFIGDIPFKRAQYRQ